EGVYVQTPWLCVVGSPDLQLHSRMRDAGSEAQAPPASRGLYRTTRRPWVIGAPPDSPVLLAHAAKDAHRRDPGGFPRRVAPAAGARVHETTMASTHSRSPPRFSGGSP